MKDAITIEEDPLSLENLIDEPSKKDDSFSNDTLAQLNKKLDEAIQKEDYELAAAIRDEINKRTSK